MRNLALVLLISCVHTKPAVDRWLEVTNPDADRVDIGDHAALAVQDDRLFVCQEKAKRTTCYLVASWAPKPAVIEKTDAPPKPEAKSDPKPEPKPEPKIEEPKPGDEKAKKQVEKPTMKK